MRRKTFDQIVTFVGFGLAGLLLVAAGLLNWGATFATGAVGEQLAAQKITIPGNTGDPDASKDVVDFFAANADKIMTTSTDVCRPLHSIPFECNAYLCRCFNCKPCCKWSCGR